MLYRDMLYRGFLLCDDIICFTYRLTAYTELFCEDTWQLETEVTKYSFSYDGQLVLYSDFF